MNKNAHSQEINELEFQILRLIWVFEQEGIVPSFLEDIADLSPPIEFDVTTEKGLRKQLARYIEEEAPDLTALRDKYVQCKDNEIMLELRFLINSVQRLRLLLSEEKRR